MYECENVWKRLCFSVSEIQKADYSSFDEMVFFHFRLNQIPA